MRWRGFGALTLGGLLAASGCGGSGALIQRFDGNPPIVTYHGDGGMDAIVSGRLAYLDTERCIVLESGTSHAVAVFPAGSDAYLESDGTLIVEMDGFGPLREGVTITGGGGNVSDDSPGIPDVAAGCSTDGRTYVVLQSISDAR